MSASKLTAVGMAPELAKVVGARLYATINALDYGVSEGSPDNAKALQFAINAAIESGSTLYIPKGLYKFTPPLNVSGPLRIVGDGCLPLWGDYAKDGNSTNIPTVAPYFSGTVLSAVSNGQSIFVDTCAGQLNFSGEDFACTFQTPFVNTGHMLDSSSTTKMGLIGSLWQNVSLFGHDGNHYAFNLTNILYNTFINTNAYGGGLISSVTTINNGGCGNSLWMRTLSILCCLGSAQCYNFGAPGGGLSQQYNAFIGVQGMTYDASGSFPGLTPPSGQNMFNSEQNCNFFSFVNPDLENHAGGGLTIMPSGGCFLDRSAGSLDNLTWYQHIAPNQSPDHMQKGSTFESGTVTATDTTGTANFTTVYANILPVVIVSGRGITAEVVSVGGNSFQYKVSAPGTFDWHAHGV
ncbi:hypothetical protein SRCM100623_00961 [Acetobacter pasteurianus]|uniref:Rhamnogalacturonase A/B/Epimerase-like pectate lyase domain-containing protein n=1 Tax=Acetobacter pasteurianus TaxID=438 RepID=A0A1A0DCR5_ACEPA|nr:glycosyl hydrolase family 28-related protein [Acetobacter pasteurianus]OAZ72422.1 hypothetical protein SRCM100623_00961 [Acetobacter pasteurianus]